MRKLLGIAAIACLAACGDDGKANMNHDAAPIDMRHIDGAIDAAIDSSIDAPIDAPPDAQIDGPAGTFMLKVINADVWCTVTVNNGTASSAGMQIVNVTPGVIPVSVTPNVGFMLAANMWHHTTGDSGSGDTGTVVGTVSTTSVTVTTANKCAWVCCPGTSLPCPTTEQCN